MNNQPTIRKPSEGRTISVVSDVYRFMATGEDTNDKYAMWEALVPPGGGPPPHVHSMEEESFYILEGEITFQIREKRVVASAGMFANMPVGTPHSFRNESTKPAKMIISVAPAGLENMFFEIGAALPEGSTSALPPTKEERWNAMLPTDFEMENLLSAREHGGSFWLIGKRRDSISETLCCRFRFFAPTGRCCFLHLRLLGDL